MNDETQSQRQAAMAAFARADETELEGPLAAGWPGLVVRDLRKAEVGLVMVRGRIGGDGAPFNLGEATVTRAVVEIEGGARGYGQTLGRKPRLARLAAIADALWQDDAARGEVERAIVEPIRRRLAAAKTRTATETAATRVDFFTLVRGDNA